MKTPIPSSETIITVTPSKIVTIKGDAICTYNAAYYTASKNEKKEATVSA